MKSILFSEDELRRVFAIILMYKNQPNKDRYLVDFAETESTRIVHILRQWNLTDQY